jgi:hypothetical protein
MNSRWKGHVGGIVLTIAILSGCEARDSVEPTGMGSEPVHAPLANSGGPGGGSVCSIPMPMANTTTICGTSVTALNWVTDPSTGLFTVYWNGGGFDIGIINGQPHASSFTLTFVGRTAAEVQYPIAMSISGQNFHEDLPLDAPGTYTMRHAGIISAGIEEGSPHTSTENPYTRSGIYSNAMFSPDCFDASDPIYDPVVGSAEVRQGLIQALFDSGFEPSAHEIGGTIVRRPDGSYFTRVVPDPNATSCAHATPTYPPLPDPEGVVVGVWHTHPHTQNEPLPVNSNCSMTSMYQYMSVTIRFKPLGNGGGSVPYDWSETRPDLPMYVITKADDRIFRLEPSTDSTKRDKNPYKWKYFPQEPGRCATH